MFPSELDAPLSAIGAIHSMLERGLRGAPNVVRGFPWLGWLVVSLIRYRDRQRWAVRHLGDRIIERGCILDEEIATLDGWRFRTSGRFAFVRCEATGEQVDLSIDEGDYDGPGRLTPDTIRPHYFAAWIESLVVGGGPDAWDRAFEARQRPERFTPRDLPASRLPEARTWRWMPSRGFLACFLDLLHDARVLEHDRWSQDFRLAPAIDALAASVVTEDFSSPDVGARWASHLGDPEVPGSDSALGPDETVAAHKQWVQMLMRLRLPGKETLLPLLLMHFGPSELVWACDALLDDDHCLPNEVLQFLVDRPRLPPSKAVSRRLSRMQVTSFQPSDAKLAIEYLHDRNIDRELATEKFLAFVEVVVADADRYPSVFADYVQLALDSFPGRALGLVRQGLRHTSDYVVQDVAGALVAMDLPWCARELTAAYREGPPQAEVLRHALGLLRQRPDDIPRFVGRSAVVKRAAWYRAHWPRWYPPDFGDDEVPR